MTDEKVTVGRIEQLTNEVRQDLEARHGYFATLSPEFERRVEEEVRRRMVLASDTWRGITFLESLSLDYEIDRKRGQYWTVSIDHQGAGVSESLEDAARQAASIFEEETGQRLPVPRGARGGGEGDDDD